MRAGILARNTGIGIASGLAASFAMDLFQKGYEAVKEKVGPEEEDDGQDGEPSTVKAANKVSKVAADEPLPEPYKEPAGQAVHYGFGALLGGAYGALTTVWPKTGTAFGMPFGAAVWAAADEVGVTAAGLSKPPTQTPPSSHAYSFLSHIVFGAALEGSRRAMTAGTDAVFRLQRQGR